MTAGKSETKELRADFDRAFVPVYSPPAPVLVRGSGARVWDSDGRDYVDFGGGVAVTSLGHASKEVADAVCEQAQTLSHTSNLHVNDATVQLARALVEATFADRVFFCNSGAEANEAALKIARRRGVLKSPEKHRILAFEGGFHGRVGFSMAATAAEKIRGGFGPLAPGFDFAPFNDLDAAAAKAGADTCAIIAEPVQGEGGVHPAAPGFLRGLREIADRCDALLILDEVQSGAGRTGALYAYMDEECGARPDILTSAKGLGGGFPVAAALCTEAAADAMQPGAHGSTYGGNPLAARAARAVLERLQVPGFLDGVKRRGDEFINRLRKINSRFQRFSEIRGRGLLIGCAVSQPDANAIVAASLEEGLIVLTAGGGTLRFAPALNISDEETEEGFARLEKALARLHNK